MLKKLFPLIAVACLGMPLTGAEILLDESFDHAKSHYSGAGWWGNYAVGKVSSEKYFSGEQSMILAPKDGDMLFCYNIPAEKLAGKKTLTVSVMHYLEYLNAGKIFPTYFIISDSQGQSHYLTGGWFEPEFSNLPVKIWKKSQNTVDISGYGKITRAVYMFLVVKIDGKSDCNIALDNVKITAE